MPALMHRRPSAATRQQGLALVEFALVLPLVVMLVLGATTLTIGLYDKAVLTHASRQAVRTWVVTKPFMSRDAVQQLAVASCQGQLISFGLAAPTCSAQASGPDLPAPGDELTVSLSMDYSGLYLFQSLSISARTRMKFE